MSTIKADTITSASSDQDLSISGSGTGVPDLETGVKVNGSALLPISVANGGTGVTAAGSSGNVLTSNGSAWASTAPAPGGAWTELLNDTIGNVIVGTGVSSYIAITEFDNSTYNMYQIFISGLYTSGQDESGLKIRTSTDGGSSYDSGASDYQYAAMYWKDGSPVESYQNSVRDYIFMGQAIGATVAEDGTNITISLFQPGGAFRTAISWFGYTFGDGTSAWEIMPYWGGGQREDSSGGVDAIQLYVPTQLGTDQGNIQMLGLKVP